MATEYRLSYTASEINNKLGKIDNFALKTEVPSKTSDLTNDSGFITENYVNAQIAAIPEPNLSAKQDKITGTVGDFVVMGADGNVTTKTVAIAEEATY